jgi:hypothetical protein
LQPSFLHGVVFSSPFRFRGWQVSGWKCFTRRICSVLRNLKLWNWSLASWESNSSKHKLEGERVSSVNAYLFTHVCSWCFFSGLFEWAVATCALGTVGGTIHVEVDSTQAGWDEWYIAMYLFYHFPKMLVLQKPASHP